MIPPNQSDERRRWLYSWLAWPAVYEAWQTLLGAPAGRRRYVAEFVTPGPGARILDMGCGPGTILDSLPEHVDYVGFDVNPQYIARARAVHGSRGKFFCQRVSDFNGGLRECQDIVLANGILHHLNDEEATMLVRTAHAALVPGGYLVTWDPVFVAGQHWLARYLISRDRGQHVRTGDGYVALAQNCFSKIEGTVRHDLNRIPFTHFLMKCTKT